MNTRSAADLAIARSALPAWGLEVNADIHLLAVSENSTYRVDGSAEGSSFTGILRVHRPGYHTVEGIKTELAWLNRLADYREVPVAAPIPTAAGEPLVCISMTGEPRVVTMFELVPGMTRDSDTATVDDFHQLGRYAALLHNDIRHHGIPGSGRRIAWDWEHLHGRSPRWGRWQDGPGVTPGVHAILDRAEQAVHERLEGYGATPDVYGFIHSDLRQANVLYAGSAMTLIDFDDAGYGWYMYDFAGSVSFLETDPRLPEWRDAWTSGYRTVASLSEHDVAMLPTFVLVRRLMLLAWLGSHLHTVEAHDLALRFASDTAELAFSYLHNPTSIAA